MTLKIPLALVLAASLLLTPQPFAGLNSGRSSGDLAGWGTPADPDGDCKFFQSPGELMITVPGSAQAHDLAAEIDRVNAPRVVQPVKGDFVYQVKIEGRLDPGAESTQENRTGYNGAGVILMADERNVITLARAVLQREGGNPQPYTNFEMRNDGQLQAIGLTNEAPLPQEGPVWLRLERRGQKVSGAVSTDGAKWTELRPKTIPESWPQDLKVGVVAISTSKAEFNPRFSGLQVVK